MSAEECRARADALVALADTCRDDDMILALEATAGEWRRLADLAEWQDAIQSGLDDPS